MIRFSCLLLICICFNLPSVAKIVSIDATKLQNHLLNHTQFCQEMESKLAILVHGMDLQCALQKQKFKPNHEEEDAILISIHEYILQEQNFQQDDEEGEKIYIIINDNALLKCMKLAINMDSRISENTNALRASCIRAVLHQGNAAYGIKSSLFGQFSSSFRSEELLQDETIFWHLVDNKEYEKALDLIYYFYKTKYDSYVSENPKLKLDISAFEASMEQIAMKDEFENFSLMGDLEGDPKLMVLGGEYRYPKEIEFIEEQYLKYLGTKNAGGQDNE